MSNLPIPLTPFGCDLSGNTWFPLHFTRLRESRWWRTASHLARSVNIDLWGRAYEQVPAGSIPDDDVDLAEWAGYGRDVAAWLKVKADVMAPWVLCSDGRWYHPTVCEMVLESWEKLSERRQKERVRKAEQRSRIRKNEPLSRDFDAPVPRDNGMCPTGQTGVSRVTAPHVPPKTGPVPPKMLPTGEERKEETSSLVASAAPSATARGQSDPWKRDQNFADLWAAATELMRRRGKSRDKVWREWSAAVKRLEPRMIVAALRRYVREDVDVQRGMGQPGLHLWLKDRVFEQWLDQQADTSAITDERWARFVQLWMAGSPWSPELGPAPDQPGCLVPSSVLRAGGCEVPKVVGLRVAK